MKKKWMKKIGIFLLLFCLIGGVVPSEITVVPVSAAAKTKTVKKGWKKEKAGWCYYVNGKKVKNKWKTISKKRYYFGADGVRKTGWYTLKASKGYKSYYFNSKGVYKKSKSINATLVKRMDAVIKKQKITGSTKKAEALKRLFEYVQKKCEYKRVMGFRAKSGWEYTYAKEMLGKKAGSCYHYAAAYAFLAKRATGYPVRICWGKSNAFNAKRWQPHAWVEIKIGKTWYTYDANAARYSALRKGQWYQQKRSAMQKKYYKTSKSVEVTL